MNPSDTEFITTIKLNKENKDVLTQGFILTSLYTKIIAINQELYYIVALLGKARRNQTHTK